MKTRAKVWLIIAVSLVSIGCMLFTAILSSVQWDFTALSTVKYTRNAYEINEAFTCISMNTDTADITFALSDDGKCRVECYEEENKNHFVHVDSETLIIERTDRREAFGFIRYIGLNFDTPKITVYLPKTEYQMLIIRESTGNIEIPKYFNFKDIDIVLSTGDVALHAFSSDRVKMKTSAGNIYVENINVGSLDLSVCTGKITVVGVSCEGEITLDVTAGITKLTDVTCRCVSSSGSTGDILFNRVIAVEKLSVDRSTGDVKFDQSDAEEIIIKTDTGNVTGSLLSEKVFFVETDTGHVDVPKTVNGGRCEIVTDTGNVRITVE